MQTKLTLRMDDSIVEKAKRLARKRGTSVSRIFSRYISEANDDQDFGDIGKITASMIGVLRGSEVGEEKEAHRAHLESKYL
jgi:predicted transcriptional regulator